MILFCFTRTYDTSKVPQPPPHNDNERQRNENKRPPGVQRSLVALDSTNEVDHPHRRAHKKGEDRRRSDRKSWHAEVSLVSMYLTSEQ